MLMLKSTHNRLKAAAVEHCTDHYQRRLSNVRDELSEAEKRGDELANLNEAIIKSADQLAVLVEKQAPLVQEALRRRASIKKSDAKRAAARKAAAAAKAVPIKSVSGINNRPSDKRVTAPKKRTAKK